MNHELFEKNLTEELSGANVPEGLIESTADFLRLSSLGLTSPRPPLVSLLAGPTGCGKTHFAYSLAKALHGPEGKLLRIDCGEFQMPHEIARLIGAPPGYLGHRETAPVLNQTALNRHTTDRSAYSVVLFDEIEKAAEQLFDLLLGVLDSGSLRLGDSSNTNFERTLILFTSNIGYTKSVQPGFACKPPDLAEKIDAAVRRTFRTEFVNRLDTIIAYPQITREGAKVVLVKFHTEAQVQCATQGIFLPDMDKKTLDSVLEEGYSIEYGTRELKRAHRKMVLAPFVRGLTLRGTIGTPASPRKTRVSAGRGL